MARSSRAILAAQRRSVAAKVALSIGLTLASLSVIAAISGGVAFLVDPDLESPASGIASSITALAVAAILVSFLLTRAYPPDDRPWGTWIIATVVLALIPLVYLPWLVVTKNRWTVDNEEAASLASVEAPPASSRAPWIIASAIVLGALILGIAVFAALAGNDGTPDSTDGDAPAGEGDFAAAAYWGSFSACSQQSLADLATTYGVPANAAAVAKAQSLAAAGLTGGGEQDAYDGCFDALTKGPSEREAFVICGTYTLDQLAELYATEADRFSVAQAVAAEVDGGSTSAEKGCSDALDLAGE